MMILWKIKATWSNKGRQGEMISVVAAPDAIEALQQFWLPEEATDLRNVTIEWLGPFDCVVNREIITKTLLS